MDCYLVDGVVLKECGDQTFIEVGFSSLARADDCDMWNVILSSREDGGLIRDSTEIAEPDGRDQ